MKQIPAPFWTLTVGVLVTLISFWVGNHHGLLPEQASAQAALVDDFFNVMIIIGTALFLVVEGAIVYSLIQFRRRKGDDSDGLPIEGNLPLEAFWTAIPAVIVIGLGVYSVQVFQDMGGFSPGDLDNPRETMMLAQAPTDIPMSGLVPEGEEASAMLAKSVYGFGAPLDREGQSADLEVDVSGMQYAWIFTYPNSGIVDGELHVPIGADVQLNISAKDVIHSFWVPQFRLKQDAIPGKDTELRFVATKLGNYPVVCAELCGGYHGAMRTQVIVHTPEEYQAWVDQRVAQGPTAATAVVADRSFGTKAQSPAEMSTPDYLAPYGEAMGMDHHLMAQLAQNPS
jgi:cytochrome c oxidase subunit 2